MVSVFVNSSVNSFRKNLLLEDNYFSKVEDFLFSCLFFLKPFKALFWRFVARACKSAALPLFFLRLKNNRSKIFFCVFFISFFVMNFSAYF